MDKILKLKILKEEAIKNDSLPLKKGATNLVFGVGNPDAEILFIGEGPGYWEDIKAEPFVGNAGMLLNQLLTSIKLKREKVFITNVIMYRPPNNRDPMPSEIDAFKPFVDGIIDIIGPKMIVTLGRFSMAKFMPGVFISSVHGKAKIVDWKGKQIIVVPMYHPAAALRNGEVKEKLTHDFGQLPKILSEKIQEKSDSIEEVKTEQMKLV